MEDFKRKRIGGIGNYYGCLWIQRVDDLYYWIIENYDTDFEDIGNWEEIPFYLADKLLRFEEE